MTDKLEELLRKLEKLDPKEWKKSGETYSVVLLGEDYRLIKGNAVRKKFIGKETILAGKLEVRTSNGYSTYGSVYMERLDKMYKRVEEYWKKEESKQ